jgi:hypothetical protein
MKVLNLCGKENFKSTNLYGVEMEHEDKQIEQTNNWGGKREGAGAPKNNQNASKSNRLYAETIKRINVQSEGQVAYDIAMALINKAKDGDISAIKEFGDRVDGKAVSTTELGTIDGQDSPLNVTLKFIKPNDVD